MLRRGDSRRELRARIFHPQARKCETDFARKVEVMARLWHVNLVRLLAYCDEVDIVDTHLRLHVGHQHGSRHIWYIYLYNLFFP